MTQQKQVFFEATPKGTRPVAPYSTDIASSWEVVEKMAMTLIPVDGGNWFAFIGTGKPWNTPADFIRFLQNENFTEAGAAVGDNAPLTICQAALKAVDAREAKSLIDAGAQQGAVEPNPPVAH